MEGLSQAASDLSSGLGTEEQATAPSSFVASEEDVLGSEATCEGGITVTVGLPVSATQRHVPYTP